MSGYAPASAKELDLSQNEIMEDRVSQLAQCELLIEYGLDELDTFFEENRPELLAFIDDNEYSKEDLHQVLDYLHSTGLAQDIQSLSVMLREEIKPILSTVIEDFTDYLPSDSEMSLERRQLVVNEGTPPRNSPSSSDDADADSNSFSQKDDFETFDLFNSVQKILSQGGAKIPERLGSMMGGIMGPFAHHRHLKHRPLGRGRHRRLQVAVDTCDSGCANATDLKVCNCDILFDCVSRLKYTDFAVIFSRGLVDKETGTIEVDVVNLDNKRLWSKGGEMLDESGNLKKEKNAAIDDIFDAIHLLQKIYKVHGLLADSNCEALLDEFHVACKDWNSACSGSDGQAYQMVSKVISRYVGLFICS